MLRRFSINFALLSMGLDLICVIISLAVATLIRPLLSELPFAAFVPDYTPIPMSLYIVFAFTWIGIFLLLSVYDGRKNFRAVDEFASITLGSILAGVSLAGFLYLSYREVSRLLFLIFVLLSYGIMLSWRIAVRVYFRRTKNKAIQNRQLVIIGAGPVGRDLQDKIEGYPYHGFNLIGFLDDDPEKRVSHEDIIGTLDDLCSVVNEYQVQDVVITLPRHAYAKVNQLVAELHNMAVKVWVVPDYFHLALHKATIEEVAGIPMLDLRAPALSDYQRLLKRGFDIAIILLLLPVSLLLMLLIMISIKLEGPGEVIFRQKRVGENGRLFDMFKFRTMVVGAEDLRHSVVQIDSSGRIIHKSRQDPRITRVGRILRKTSLDDLPQFLNILRGEMSLVGPRPELPYLVESYEPWQRKRFAVPQGITGWWQVNGRSDKPMHLHTEDDLYYVQNYSLLLDIQILFKTILVVLRGKGAF